MSKVLIADDENATTFEYELRPILEPFGITLCTARDGDECLQLVEQIHPDLILLDVQLPVIDGYEVLAELKQRRVVTRVMMVTGYATNVDAVIRCVRAGACDYILKGSEQTRPQELAKRIRRNLLMNNTTVVSLADLSPVQQELVKEATRLRDQLAETKEENKKLLSQLDDLNDERRRQRDQVVFAVVQKLSIVAIALLGCLVLRRIGFDVPGVPVAVLFVTLLLLLLIPAEKIQSLSASLKNVFRAVVVIGDEERHAKPEDAKRE
jgi:CheY-like chemotaxis protein